MQEKVSLSLYRKWRKEIGGQEELYDNSEASTFLFKCRTNNVNLGDRKRFNNQPTKCIMCDYEYEDLNNFLLYCPAYNQQRNKILMLQRPYIQDEQKIIGELLFEKKLSEHKKETIYIFWKIREQKIKISV